MNGILAAITVTNCTFASKGILAGAPRLTPTGFGAAQSLNLGVPDLPGATIFGAHDPRGPAGAAVGD